MSRVSALLLAALVGLLVLAPGSAQGAWRITHFDSVITVDEQGTTHFEEAIEVNFGASSYHGIFREIVTRQRCGDVDAPSALYECPSGSDRLYPLSVEGVTDASGTPVQYEEQSGDGSSVLKIGDPDVTVTGVQTYRIRYTLDGALNAFEGHDELYWNVTGSQWPGPIESVTVTLALPEGASVFVACYQGDRSAAPCLADGDGNMAAFAATRSLFPGEELTIAAGWQKGIVALRPPVLEDRVSIDDFFTFDWVEYAGAALFALLGLVGVARAWWLFGRDRRYRTVYYLTEDPSQEVARLFSKLHIVVEFLPPEDLRPAQMGVIVDERADTLDVTATIIDLAVRGYLHITELEKRGWFGKGDWELKRLKETGDELLPYEQRLLDALFKTGDTVKVSSLKTKFVEDLKKVKDDLYDDAMKRRWFSRRPETARTLWLLAGIVVVGAGVGLSVLSGLFLERALMPAPLVLAGLALTLLSRSMARRTATGSEALRRVLGFKLYITTAETRRQEFNEQQGIFARYLPYAIVFECVDKWAEAFEGLEDQVQDSTALWYTGMTAFHLGAFTSSMGSFAGNVSSVMQATPGGSGGSGFSGGFSGGGGGGGGGGAW